MKKYYLIAIIFMLGFRFSMAQEMNISKKVETNLVEIKKVVKLENESYEYISQLLVYYYKNIDNTNLENKNNIQIKENVYFKLKAKLTEEEFDSLNRKWLSKNLN